MVPHLCTKYDEKRQTNKRFVEGFNLCHAICYQMKFKNNGPVFYSRLYLGRETDFFRLLQRMARMEMD